MADNDGWCLLVMVEAKDDMGEGGYWWMMMDGGG